MVLQVLGLLAFYVHVSMVLLVLHDSMVQLVPTWYSCYAGSGGSADSLGSSGLTGSPCSSWF